MSAESDRESIIIIFDVDVQFNALYLSRNYVIKLFVNSFRRLNHQEP